MSDEEGFRRPADDFLLALGRAAYGFMSLEWAVIWLAEALSPGKLSSTLPPSGTALAQYLEDSVAQALISEAELPSGLVEFANCFAELALEHQQLISGHPYSGSQRPTELLFTARTGRRGWGTEKVLQAAQSFEEATGTALRLVQELKDGFTGPVDEEPGVAAMEPGASDDEHRIRNRFRDAVKVRARLGGHEGVERLDATGLEIYVAEHFFDEAECGELIQLIERDLYPSGLLAPAADPGFRTSMSCNLKRADPPVAELEKRICDLLGIDPSYSETAQGQRYEVGQEFKPHHDFFHAGQIYTEQAEREGGQRTWTAMLFLNEPEAGGCTNFPDAGVKVVPEPGKLLVWNNLDERGNPNSYSLHQGMPVERGSKYVITKWFRERVWEPGATSKSSETASEA